MPIPKPNKGESKNDFVSRCMGNETMRKEFPDQKQRAAVCNDSYNKSKESIKRDEDGRIIVAENVPLIFTSTIESDTDDEE